MKYDYRLYVLSPDGRLLGDPSAMSIYDRPIVDATLLDGWVLLGTADHTRAVPVPVAP